MEKSRKKVYFIIVPLLIIIIIGILITLGLNYKYDSNNGKEIYNKIKNSDYNFEIKNNALNLYYTTDFNKYIFKFYLSENNNVTKYSFNEYPLDKNNYIVIYYYSNYDQYVVIKNKNLSEITYDMVTEEKVKGKRNINKTEKSNIENLDDINFDILYEMDVSQDDLFDFANYYLMNIEVLKRYDNK